MLDESVEAKHRYFIVNKPYDMLSQFITNEQTNRLLAHLNFDFPAGIHAIGRLDNLSEGLLILTTNKKITKLLFQSKQNHVRKYLVQVTNTISNQTIETIKKGVTIHIKGGVDYVTKPCEAKIVDETYYQFSNGRTLNPRMPTSWILISLTEGKFHQVRKMVFAMKHRCLRLIRLSISNLQLGTLAPGEVKEVSENDFFQLLNLKR